MARVRAVPGHEFSGVITAIGKDVPDFEIGDEVYGMNDWFVDGATAEFSRYRRNQAMPIVRVTEKRQTLVASEEILTMSASASSCNQRPIR
jgi:NADPH:quinone reductase-like Zn-dependent oxidoreductase